MRRTPCAGLGVAAAGPWQQLGLCRVAACCGVVLRVVTRSSALNVSLSHPSAL